jgi:thioredoxin-related protein
MKKRIFTLVFLIATLAVSAQEIEWMSMNEALEAQQKEPKKIFMDVYTTWCGPCKLLDKNTFQNEEVAKFINDNFYAVKFNAEGTEKVDYQDYVYTNPNHDPKRKGRNSQHLFAHALKVSAYPSMVFFDEESNIIAPITGYHTPKDLEVYLKMIASNDYKDVTTTEAWKEYEANFEGTFK